MFEDRDSVGQQLLADGTDPRASLAAIAEAVGGEYVENLPTEIPPDLAGVLTPQQARRYRVAPLRREGRRLRLLMVDPPDREAIGDLEFALGCEIQIAVADPVRAATLIERCYGEEEGSLGEWLHELEEVETLADSSEEIPASGLESLAGQAPVIRFVNRVLAQAVRDQASDIHFEPFEREFKIRYRVDGVLYELPPPAKSLALPITSRLKVLANLDIAERRLPQDGRIKVALAGRAVDLRVSTLPTQFGESVVLRVLDQSAVGLEISQLGMPTDVRAGVEEVVRRPNGIFIVTGPTGSGKTTTLYSALRLINRPDLKILTIEDPVEYQIEGIMQVPVNLAAGLTFASALRSFLRQDPDVIMVGEIRDAETAQIAIQAALTGHLVLTTLHTNDAAGAVTRLIDMGIEPFLIASTVEAVLAQRLVRCVCPRCRVPAERSLAAFRELTEPAADLSAPIFEPGGGCAFCDGTGYRGRSGIFEWLRVTDELREAITNRASTQALRERAIAEGMRTLRDEGRRAILSGRTTVDEVAKYV